MALLACYGVVQTAFVEIHERNSEIAFARRAFHQGVVAVQLYVILYIGPLVLPRAASVGVRTAANQLIQHRGEKSRDGKRFPTQVYRSPARRACLIGGILSSKCPVQAVLAEDVLTGKADRFCEGGAAYETDKILVTARHIIKQTEI